MPHTVKVVLFENMKIDREQLMRETVVSHSELSCYAKIVSIGFINESLMEYDDK